MRDGLIQWQHNRELLAKHGVTETGSIPSTVADSKYVSVMTPSVARFSSQSVDPHFHSSNPNPQVAKPRFKPVGDERSQTTDKFDLLKFGKRIVFGKRMTND